MLVTEMGLWCLQAQPKITEYLEVYGNAVTVKTHLLEMFSRQKD